jgi:ceramide glucosyltransferase
MIPVPYLAHTLPLAAQVIAAFFTLMTLAALAYSLLVFRAARSYSRAAHVPLPDFTPPVSILKPVKGLDPEMYAAFASHCRQDYPADYEILFGLHDMDDPAVQAIEKLQQEFPAHSIRIIVCPEILGTNGKVSNLVQMLPHARFDYLLINDSDIHVSTQYLRHTMPAFAIKTKKQRQVGMVTALYRGRAHGTLKSRLALGSRLEALGISTDFMPGVLTARWLEKGLRFGLGSTLAVTRRALNAIGGFAPLVDHLADDYELGARIFRAGYRVETGREVAETSIPAYRFPDFLAHQLRWARGVRDARPLGYFGLLITFGLPWALANVIASAASLDSIALLSAMLCVRIAIALTIGVGVLQDRACLRDIWLLPLRDFIALGIWFWSFADDHIVWRGEKFLLRDGKLIRDGNRITSGAECKG